MSRLYVPELATAKQVRAKVRYMLPKASTLLCVDCGKSAHDYDHYDGYGENWKKVEPVCCSCHSIREHKRGVRGARGRQILIGPRMERGFFFTQTKIHPGKHRKGRG